MDFVIGFAGIKLLRECWPRLCTSCACDSLGAPVGGYKPTFRDRSAILFVNKDKPAKQISSGPCREAQLNDLSEFFYKLARFFG